MSTAQELMNEHPIVVSPEMSVQALAALLLEQQADGACVIEDDKLVGVVTTMDLVFQEKNVHIPTFVALMDAVIPLESNKRTREDIEKIAGTWVRDIMSDDPITVGPDSTVSDAATLMVERHLTMLPVVKEGQLLGVITKHAILKAAFNLS